VTEDEFERAVGRIEAVSRLAAADDVADLDFGLAEDWDLGLERLGELIEGFVRFAAIETRIESSSVARTVVGWTGNLATVYSPALADAGQQRAHFEALAETLRARARIIRIVSASLGAVAAISTVAATPLGAVNAFRAVAQLTRELESVAARTRADSPNPIDQKLPYAPDGITG
jgi:hypothetical protein